MDHLQKSRVSADFPMHERDILQQLCDQDIRPPAEQIRWLVLNEAKRRGLQPTENSKIASVKVRPSPTGDFAGINP